jgi:hypothetical protein
MLSAGRREPTDSYGNGRCVFGATIENRPFRNRRRGFCSVRDVFLYYSPLLLGSVWRAVDPVAAAMTFSTWKLLVEIPRTLGVTLVMARFRTMLGDNDQKSAAKLALWLWFGFSALMWAGAVTWEQIPWLVAAIHSKETGS